MWLDSRHGTLLTAGVFGTILTGVKVSEREGASLVTVQDVIQRLESDGWQPIEGNDCCRRFKHDTNAGIVTLSGKLELVVPRAVLQTLLRCAQLEEGD
jgi:predicted RNA binding protein YcfA (HicA-like mRNA interferase family)